MPRFKRSIQYAAASRLKHCVSGILDRRGQVGRRRQSERHEERVKAQNCPALASSTSTRSSISDSTASRPGSPEDDFRAAAASRSRFTVEVSKLPDKQPDLEIVEHVERAAAARDRALAPLDRILVDALQREQRVDVAGGLWRCCRARLLRRSSHPAARSRSTRCAWRCLPASPASCRSVRRCAWSWSREELGRKDRPVMVNDA